MDHHDAAYRWAERRKLETHPTTGAAQFVEIRETVKEIVVPVYVSPESSEAGPSAPPLAGVSEAELLCFGVPEAWLADVRNAPDEDALLALADHLPAEAAEAVLELATGGKPRAPQPAAAGNPFEHPDAQRRFRVVANAEELQRAPSNTRGKSGRCSCTPSSGSGSSMITTARRAFPGRPERARPSWRCTGRRTWRVCTRMRASF